MNTCSDSERVPARFAEVAPDAWFADRRTTLTYGVPEPLAEQIEVGQLIWIPLRRKLALGVVVERHDRTPVAVDVRDIHAPVEPTFCLTPRQWQLAAWIAEETICSLFEAASLMFPPGVGNRAVEFLVARRTPSAGERGALTAAQLRLIDLLDREGEIALDGARRLLGSSLTSIVPALEELGLLQRVARVRHREVPRQRVVQIVRLVEGAVPPPAHASRQAEAYTWLSRRLRARAGGSLPLDDLAAADGGRVDRTVLRALVRRGCIVIEDAPDAPHNAPAGATDVVLTHDQRAAWDAIRGVLGEDRGTPILLHGVTGSGKTEIYLRVAAHVLAEGRSAIVLVPEIGLSGQIAERFRARFGDRAIVLHSALDDRARYENWTRAASGEALVVVGPRSALFAPLPAVGAIILDEEHEHAYKQDSVPRYHARTVAGRLANLHGAVCILGSATPDVETYYHAGHPGWLKVELRERVGQRALTVSGDVYPMPIPMPDTRIVDMRAELRAGNPSIFSRDLRRVIDERLAADQQVILFLNRRGASTLVQCRACGHVSQCPYCDIPLVYHREGERLVCHRCGQRSIPRRTCAECGVDAISYYGAGTQRVEDEIRALQPSARVLRWDQDALRGSTTHEELLGRVARHEVDIVVGTQMIAKGLDLPGVGAVGVINADTYLFLPDLRAAERTFQMLTQVAGRAGRRVAGGEVIIQTYSPQHYSITSASAHDYAAFYIEEIAFRRRHGYPPFKRLTRLLYRHRDEVEARAEADRMAGELEQLLRVRPETVGVDILGPAPAFATRVRGRYGWQILLRGANAVPLLASLRIRGGWVVDVDPLNLL